MTEVNKRLSGKLQDIELLASTCLNTQPDSDSACERYLRKTLSKIAEESSEFLKRGRRKDGRSNTVE